MRDYDSYSVAATESIVRKKSGARMIYIGIIVGLAVMLAAMTAAFVARDFGKNSAEARLNDYYFESVSELSDSVDEVVLNLSKLSLNMSRATTSETLNELSTYASEGASALSRLPIDGERTYPAMKLLNQIVDFAAAYNSAVGRGYDTDGYVKSAAKFRRAAETLQQRVDEMEEISRRNGRITSDFFSPSNMAVGDDRQEVTPDYPEMIYDGPFSDGKLPTSFKSLENMEEVTEEEALYRFGQLLNVSGAKIIGHSSEPDAYEIEAGDAYGSVSVKGCMFLSLSIADRTGDEENLDEEDAYMHAEEYAAKLGYGDLTPVWYLKSGSVAYINMTPTVGDTILYTDLVKVKISLTDGTLLGLEATGYCRNHIERDISAVISERTAAELSGIDYDSVRLCVIPDKETEAVCYEVHGTFDEMEFYVYVDAVTGERVKALKVVNSYGGRLTA